MTYRSGWREYLTMFLIFGGVMGLLNGAVYRSLGVGVACFIVFGGLFTLLMYIFSKIVERRFSKLREEIGQHRKVICDGGATIRGIGGWMYLTDWGLEFYPHKISTNTDEISLPMKSIVGVRAYKNQVIIDTAGGAMLAVVVARNRDWVREISDAAFKEE